MAEINDNIIENDNINIDAAGEDAVKAEQDFDVAQAKAAGDLDAELFARFQKFGRAMHAASKGKRPCPPKNVFAPGVAAHMEGGPTFDPRGPKCGPDFAKGFRPGAGFGPGCGGPKNFECEAPFGGRGPMGPKGPMGAKGPGFREHGFGDPKGPGCAHAPFHGGMGAMKIPNAPAPGFGGPKNGFAPMGPMGPKCRPEGNFGPGANTKAGFGGPKCGPDFGGGHGFGPKGPHCGPDFGGGHDFGLGKGFGPGCAPQCGPDANFGKGADFAPGFGPDAGRMGRGRVLVALSMQDNMTQKDLAFLLGIRPQSLSELVGKLEADGFVTRTRSEADRRAVTVSLTDEGRAKAAKIQAKRNASAETLFAKLTAEEKETLIALLAKLQD